MFNETLTLPIRSVGASSDAWQLTLEVWDRNVVTASDFLGEVTLHLPEVFATAGHLGAVVGPIQEILRDPKHRCGKPTQKELQKRIAAGNKKPHGAVELKLSFAPNELN